jgi:hypothetical protein
LNAKVGRENIFKPTIGNKSLHQDSNDNDVRIVNFATSKNPVVRRTMFLHRNIHKYTWTSPDGKNHNEIDHILIDRRWHSSILDVQSFRGADSDTDHCLIASTFREIFNLRKLNELKVRTQYQTEITNRDAALENLGNGKDIYKEWENIKENIKTSAKVSLGLHKLKQHKPWFD